MKKFSRFVIVIAVVIACFLKCDAVYASGASSEYSATIYDTDGSGLALKEKPDIESERILVIPENTEVRIDGVTSTGWGYTSYGEHNGWIYLQYTLVGDECSVEIPAETVKPEYYLVTGTGEEGLQLRVRPMTESSTFGPVKEDTLVLVRAIQGEWAFVLYGKTNGWLSMSHLEKWKKGQPYKAAVYDTEGAGLALKADADIESERYMVLPEGEELVIDKIDSKGWGHTVYNEQEGWVSLRYTKVIGAAGADMPAKGLVKPKEYIVKGTEDQGLELRMSPRIESSSFGSLDEDSYVYVRAVEGDWAYVCAQGNYGWCSMQYLREAGEK